MSSQEEPKGLGQWKEICCKSKLVLTGAGGTEGGVRGWGGGGVREWGDGGVGLGVVVVVLL